MVFCSGADLAALVREASVQTLKEFMKCSIASEDSYKTLELRMEHFEKAFHKLRPSVSLEVINVILYFVINCYDIIKR